MFTQFNTLVESYQSELQNYALKPTKASSKRLRALITQMKKIATATKQELIDLDKGE